MPLSLTRVLLVVAFAVLVAAAVGGWWLATRAPEVRLSTSIVQSGLDVPWDLAFAGDGRMVVTERPGRLRVFASGAPGAELLATVDVPEVRAEGEGGVMGVAVGPASGGEAWVYVCASRDPDGADGEAVWLNQLLRYRLGAAGSLTFEDVLFDPGMRAHVHHDGCAVELDATGHLWLTMGDANTGSGANLAQDPDSPNGKVLRIRADGSIPQDNPLLPGAASITAAWSMGHRNPQGLVLGDEAGTFAVEHGTDTNDELNRIVRGANYGYGCVTGFGTDGPATTWCEGTAAEAFREPMWTSGSPTLATSGAALLPGDLWGAWGGDLVVTTLKEADLRRFELSPDSARATLAETLLDEAFGRLRAAVIGPDGALYLTTSNADGNDRIIRVQPAPS